ncbi:MAG: NAD synthetase [Pelagibacterales bacterium]|nr:NAD synthetase [Pelagibacterales bacterium]OUU61372.1 MAG: NAD synthetase [Alphaproteobacteria bacterium TMED62]
MENVDPFIINFIVFTLAIFVGYFVVWAVTPALHTPLMSVTNAISGIIIVGSLTLIILNPEVNNLQNNFDISSLMGFLATILASINVFGGFMVTQRMLAMYKKKKKIMNENFSAILYLISSVFFILALKGLSSPETARRGNIFGILGMLIAVITLLLQPNTSNFIPVIICILLGGAIGTTLGLKIKMTAMPQLVAGFHSLVGLAAVFVAAGAYYAPEKFGISSGDSIKIISAVEMSIGLVIGAITFSGSIIAFLKLQSLMSGNPITFKFQHALNALLGTLIIISIYFFVRIQSNELFILLTLMALIIGILIIIPIGGADMPVVVSMLNSYSGWAAAGIGFTLENISLIIVGALVGSSGAILSYIMCKAMNRSFISVILGGFGEESSSVKVTKTDKTVKSGGATDGSFIMKNSEHVIIVPGYGMAVSQAQHVVKEMSDLLRKHGVKVSFAIHPVAGRMPGHMNVLLAEANVSYDEVFELEEINSNFSSCDVAFVIGANDITNPAAKTDPNSPIAGMPILDVENAKTVLFVKRSLSPGYAGIDNKVFYNENTLMLFGDAKKIVEEIVKELA